MSASEDVAAAAPVGTAGFRGLMACFPTGVAIVTTVDSLGRPHGLTCSSLCSVSLEPPLLLVCIANTSRTLAAVKALGLFAVNMLHKHGRDAARAFSSTRRVDRFAVIAWSPTTGTRLPCLHQDAHAIAECRVRTTEVVGDHTVVVGEVISAEHLSSIPPLLYGMREYATWPGSPKGGCT